MYSVSSRWDALDVLRGLPIMLMLLNLSPGSWEFNYSWLTHAKWDGWTLIDMVAPASHGVSPQAPVPETVVPWN